MSTDDWSTVAEKQVRRLNASQRAIHDAAVAPTNGDRRLRVLASAGSGKTGTISALMMTGLNRAIFQPERVVVTTFTRKAAEELKARVKRGTDPAVFARLEGARRIGTFHAITLSWLTKHLAGAFPHKWNGNVNLDTVPDPWEDERARWLDRLEKATRQQGIQVHGVGLYQKPPAILGDIIWFPKPRDKPWQIKRRKEQIAAYQIPELPLDIMKWYRDNDVQPPEDLPTGRDYALALGIARSYGLHPQHTARDHEVTITHPKDEDQTITLHGPEEVADALGLHLGLPLLWDVWVMYERIKASLRAYDFEDALYYFWRDSTLAADLVIVDEAQDNSWIQLDISRKIAERANGRLMLVGDIRQCIPAGQMIDTPDGARPVQDIQVGDKVYTARGGQRVSGVVTAHSESQKTTAYEYTLADGRKFRATPEHALFSALPTQVGKVFVYLMQRDGYGFRIGTTAGSRNQARHNVLVRCNQEQADRLWVLASFDRMEDALILERTLAYRYRVPMDPFKPRDGGAWGGSSSERIRSFFEEFKSNGHALLADFRLAFDKPNFLSRGGGERVVVNLLLGASGGAEVAADSGLLPDVPALAGFNFQKGSKEGRRVRRWFSDVREATHAARSLRDALVDQYEIPTTVSERLSGTLQSTVFAVPAASVLPGCLVPVLRDGGTDLVEVVAREEVPCGACYDLEVASAGNFCVNGVVVHNSIYSFRGANPAVVRDSDERKGYRTLEIPTNYRSGSSVVALGNEICYSPSPLSPDPSGKPPVRASWSPGADAVAARRVDPTVIREARLGSEVIPFVPITLESRDVNRTDTFEGTVRSLAFPTAAEEASGIGAEVSSLLAQGVPHQDIALLARTNAEGTFLEMGLLGQKIPVMRIGRGRPFFDTPAIQEVLGWLAAACGDNAAALDQVLRDPKRDIFMKAVYPLLRGDLGRGSARDALRALDRHPDANKFRKSSFMEALWDLEQVAKQPWPRSAEVVVELTTGRTTKALQEDEDEDADADESDLSALQTLLTVAHLFESYEDFAKFRERLRKEVGRYTEEQLKSLGDENLLAPGDRDVLGPYAGIATTYRSLPDMIRQQVTGGLSEEETRTKTANVNHFLFEAMRRSRVLIGSVHSAKGLEWGWVYLTSSAGTFPSARASTPTQIAEERRLFYVACTRAKDVLTVTSAAENAQGKKAGPSSFVRGWVRPRVQAGTSVASSHPFDVPGWTRSATEEDQIVWTDGTRTLELLRTEGAHASDLRAWGIYWSHLPDADDVTEVQAATTDRFPSPADAMPAVRAVAAAADAEPPPGITTDGLGPVPAIPLGWVPSLVDYFLRFPTTTVTVDGMSVPYGVLARWLRTSLGGPELTLAPPPPPTTLYDRHGDVWIVHGDFVEAVSGGAPTPIARAYVEQKFGPLTVAKPKPVVSRTATPPAPTQPTDEEGWLRLADRVDVVLSDQPQAIREALKGVFLEEAGRA